MRGIVNVFGVCSQFPVTDVQATSRGFWWYGCWPMSDGDGSACSHHLTLLGVLGEVKSDVVFEILAPFGVYSYKWITYFLVEVDSVGD